MRSVLTRASTGHPCLTLLVRNVCFHALQVMNMPHYKVAAQNFEYKISCILDKPTESMFGYISVLVSVSFISQHSSLIHPLAWSVLSVSVSAPVPQYTRPIYMLSDTLPYKTTRTVLGRWLPTLRAKFYTVTTQTYLLPICVCFLTFGESIPLTHRLDLAEDVGHLALSNFFAQVRRGFFVLSS